MSEFSKLSRGVQVNLTNNFKRGDALEFEFFDLHQMTIILRIDSEKQGMQNRLSTGIFESRGALCSLRGQTRSTRVEFV